MRRLRRTSRRCGHVCHAAIEDHRGAIIDTDVDRHLCCMAASGRLRRSCHLFRFIEGWYDPHRRHSACSNQTPMRYEMLYAMSHQPAA